MYEIGSFSTAVNSVNATLTIDHKFTNQREIQEWAAPVDTAGDPCTTLTAVNAEQITIHGINQLTTVYNNSVIPKTCVISGINCAILGLDTIMRNGLRLTVDGCRGYLGNDQTEVKLQSQSPYTTSETTSASRPVFDGLCNYVDYTKDFESWYYGWYDESLTTSSRRIRSTDYIKKIHN
eukprot:593164-Amphidinium_carterae.1